MNFQLGTAIGTFNGMYMLMTTMLTLLHQQVDQGVTILHPLGEFCIFAPFWHVLMISISFAAVPVSFAIPCICSMDLSCLQSHSTHASAAFHPTR